MKKILFIILIGANLYLPAAQPSSSDIKQRNAELLAQFKNSYLDHSIAFTLNVVSKAAFMAGLFNLCLIQSGRQLPYYRPAATLAAVSAASQYFYYLKYTKIANNIAAETSSALIQITLNQLSATLPQNALPKDKNQQ